MTTTTKSAGLVIRPLALPAGELLDAVIRDLWRDVLPGSPCDDGPCSQRLDKAMALVAAVRSWGTSQRPPEPQSFQLTLEGEKSAARFYGGRDDSALDQVASTPAHAIAKAFVSWAERRLGEDR